MCLIKADCCYCYVMLCLTFHVSEPVMNISNGQCIISSLYLAQDATQDGSMDTYHTWDVQYLHKYESKQLAEKQPIYTVGKINNNSNHDIDNNMKNKW